MIELPKEFDSIFRYIVVVSQRAEQIINGAKPRSESRYAKPTLVARDDVEDGKVSWRILSQEELDAHRQALVEQFRAEVDAELLDQGLAVGIEFLLRENSPGDLSFVYIFASLQGWLRVPALGSRLCAVDDLLGTL